MIHFFCSIVNIQYVKLSVLFLCNITVMPFINYKPKDASTIKIPHAINGMMICVTAISQ